MPAACRHVSSHSGASRLQSSPVDGVGVCFARPVMMSLMALRVLVPKQRAAIPMGGSGTKAGAVGICSVAGCTAVPWGCGGGRRGADAGVEELHIVSRHEAHPQTVEQSGEQGVGPRVLGHLQRE